jgi:deoxyribonuclease-4
VEHADGNELRYTPIKKGDLRFEPLAECLLDEDYDLTIVSSSPLLEHDAMYMKVILERVLAKRLVRPTKPEKAEKEEKEIKAEKRR